MTPITDLRAAARLWRRKPALPLLATMLLACGLGSTAGIFAMADAILWRALPLPASSRLVWIQSVDRGQPGDSSPGLVRAWMQRARTVETLGALRPVQGTWRDRAGTDRLDGAQASAAAIRALGLHTTYGRVLLDEDERTGATPAVLITNRLWLARYGGRPDTVGQLVEIDGRGRTIVGVLGEAADRLPFGGDWYVPLGLPPGESGTGPRYLDVLARLAPDSDAAAAGRELSTIAAAAGAVGDDGSPLGVRVEPIDAAFTAGAARVLLPLLGGALLVLLMTAVNAANLRLADQLGRRGEFAIRAALGASRAQLVRQLLVEALLVSAAAGLAGLLVAQWSIAGLELVLPAETQQGAVARVDTRAVAFMALLVVGVTALSAVMPALSHTRGALATNTLVGSRGVIGGDDRLRRAFVVVQIAIAMTLGAAAVTMFQTTRHLADVARPSRSGAVWTAAIRLSSADFPGAGEISSVAARILDRVATLPGVAGAAVASRVPFSGGAPGSDVALVGEPAGTGADRQTRIRFVTPGYFDAVGSRILEGRDVVAADVTGSEPVVLVNETLAARLTPGRSPVGQSVIFGVRDFNGATPTAWRIVGLVADSRDRGPRLPSEPEIYLSLAQGPAGVHEWIGRQLLLVIPGSPSSPVTPALLRAAVRDADPRVPAFDLRTLEQRFATHVSVERLLAGVLVPMGIVGVALAGFGVFAIVMHDVHQRAREMALRIVLGAAPAAIVREAGRVGATTAGLGIALGGVGAMGAGRLLASVAFGVTAGDPSILAPAAALLVVTTVAAAWIPARRAARQDPATVLRAE